MGDWRRLPRRLPRGGCGDHPPPVRSSAVWHSPPGSTKPHQEDPRRLTQQITAMPGPRPRAGTIPNTAAGFCVSACATHSPPPPAPPHLRVPQRGTGGRQEDYGPSGRRPHS